jgi:Icc protein
MTETVTFVHITDLHVNAPGLDDPGLRSDTSSTLMNVVGLINAMSPLPSFVIASGDITNRGDEASFRHARSILAALKVPILHALGNHDSRAGYNKGMLDADGDAPLTYDRVIAGVHVIVLDSTVAGMIGGALADDQFAFLDTALDRHPELRKLVVVHHPPAIGGENPIRWEKLDEADTERLGRLIEGRNVAGIFCGHVHYDRVALWHGVPVVISNGLHNANDILFTGGLRMVEGTGFALCRLRPSGLDVSFVPLAERAEHVAFPRETIMQFR